MSKIEGVRKAALTAMAFPEWVNVFSSEQLGQKGAAPRAYIVQNHNPQAFFDGIQPRSRVGGPCYLKGEHVPAEAINFYTAGTE